MTDLSEVPVLRARRGGGRADTTFRLVAAASAVLTILIVAAIGLLLALRATDALQLAGPRFLTERSWFPDAEPPRFGVLALAFGTVLSSALALVMAVPVAVGGALFLTEVASPRTGRALGYLVDLLAAVPSVVYGLWGLVVLVPALVPVQRFLDRWLGWIPFFDNRSGTYGRSVFAASVVLAVMVLPIIAALAREVFVQVPRAHREAALALGATRWETIRWAVLPFGRGGVVGAIMLGLGRALGETIAVALVLAAAFTTNVHVTEPGGNTIAANIATKFGEAGSNGRSALIASGLVLFAITFAVNAIGRIVVRRSVRQAVGRP